MIFARKMTEFYIIIGRKIFIPNFRGHVPPLPPRLLRLCVLPSLIVFCRISHHIFDVCCLFSSSSTSGMGEERPCGASAAGEAVFGGVRDLVQLSTSLIVSGRGRFSVSGSRSPNTPVTNARPANTMPGTQLAYLACSTLFSAFQNERTRQHERTRQQITKQTKTYRIQFPG